MDFLERLEVLESIIEAAGGKILGKTKFQKLVYLAQEKGLYLGYDFGYHYFGVFSSELEMDLQSGEVFGVFSQDVKSDYYGCPIEISLKDMNQVQSVDSSNSALSMVSELSKEESRVLEVLSTIIYLKKAGYDGAKLESILERLKGHLKEFFPRAWELNEKFFN